MYFSITVPRTPILSMPAKLEKAVSHATHEPQPETRVGTFFVLTLASPGSLAVAKGPYPIKGHTAFRGITTSRDWNNSKVNNNSHWDRGCNNSYRDSIPLRNIHPNSGDNIHNGGNNDGGNSHARSSRRRIQQAKPLTRSQKSTLPPYQF